MQDESIRDENAVPNYTRPLTQQNVYQPNPEITEFDESEYFYIQIDDNNYNFTATKINSGEKNKINLNSSVEMSKTNDVMNEPEITYNNFEMTGTPNSKHFQTEFMTTGNKELSSKINMRRRKFRK